MNLNTYQKEALKLATYENVGHNAVYPALGIAEEAGECAGKVKKRWRNEKTTDGKLYSEEHKVALAKEIGDVLWYAAALSFEIGYTLDEIAEINLDKLQDRRERGVLKSEGDNR